jgi:hypothetical protein
MATVRGAANRAFQLPMSVLIHAPRKTLYAEILQYHYISCFANRMLSGIKCRSEFCWSCLNDYKAIRKLGNSEHKPTCKFHSDNLPDMDGGGVDQDDDSD